jgi:hypothetical protein
MADSDQTAEPARESAGDRRTREPTPNEAEGVTGGADAVEKTTDVADVHGAEVEEREPPPVPLTATVSSGAGFGAIGWAAILLALLAFATYAMGLFQ